MPGFLAPDVLYLATAPQDRAYTREVLGRMRERYPRYVEPCVGAFGSALEAREKGYLRIETSDVSLFSSLIGYLATGRHPGELEVAVDGETLALDDDHFRAGGQVLHAALVLRYEARPNAEYWKALVDDLHARREAHVRVMAKHLRKMADRLTGPGFSYRALDLWVHLEETLDDEQAMVVLDPPVYKAGYEKLWDTGGRLAWAEPTYELFDPADDFDRLRRRVEGAAALVLVGEQTTPGACAHPTPVYARHVLQGEYVYAWTNRPQEVALAMGGLRVVTRRPQEAVSIPLPLLEPDDDVTEESRVEVVPVTPPMARYYKDLWLHRITGAETGFAFALTLDGKLAGLASVSTTPITRPYKNKPREKRDGILIRWVVHPPHPLRLARLLTLVCLQRPVLEKLMPPKSQLYLGMSTRVVTIEYSRHPEVKGLRGLMKLTEREKHPDGHKLTYESPFGSLSLEECLTTWLAKERRYAAA